jgi:hypothetical protein
LLGKFEIAAVKLLHSGRRVIKIVIFLQSSRARLPGKAAGQGCRARLPGKAAGQGCRATVQNAESMVKLDNNAVINVSAPRTTTTTTKQNLDPRCTYVPRRVKTYQ